MEHYSVLIPPDVFGSIVDYGKKMKSTFTMVGYDGIYGFNGVVSEKTKSFQLGCMKEVVTVPTTEPIIIRGVGGVPIKIAMLTKNITALAKSGGQMVLEYDMSNGYIKPCSIHNDQIECGMYNDSTMTVVRNQLMLDALNGNVIYDKDITNEPDFVRICAMKADMGGDMLRLSDFKHPIFAVSNIIGLNKGDTVRLTVTQNDMNTAVVQFTVTKKTKKVGVVTTYRILLL